MKLNILPLVIYMVHDYSFFGSTADFVIKKEHLKFLPDLAKLQTSGRNMTIELDSRHPLLPKSGWENEDLTLILRKKNGNLCRYKCFQCWCKREKHENKQNYNC
jgi:hypothetical protein